MGARVASWTRPPATHGTHHTTRPTTTPPTHVGGNLQCPLGNRVSQRLRDHGLGAQVGSWTRQPAIHGTQHTTRATSTAPTPIDSDLQRSLPGKASRSACVITAWALEWLARRDKLHSIQRAIGSCRDQRLTQQPIPPSTPLGGPLHHRPTSAAICSARSGTAFTAFARHSLGARVA